MDFIEYFKVPKAAKIIDVGGGDSFLVDHLLALGYEDITVLDISEVAIDKAKERLGNLAKKVKWIIADIANFKSSQKYDVWHDRAAFHFLTEKKEIQNYIDATKQGITIEGILIIGTFSEDGPKKCSRIDITNYSQDSLNNLMKDSFKNVKSIYVDHKTPFNTVQNFVFSGFKKI
ncbi:class I SAM-dependent methyltransferase [Aquimarina sp. MMG016]|uniref:class I SAM-dependent methyltransferase n=1 Tax=Aquimarina sp. MMG016 TaxID=2822690 RepID=UPI0032B3BCC7